MSSFSCSIAGWAMLGYKGYNYFLNQSVKEYQDYFIASVVCVSVSYLINLIVGIIVFSVSSFLFGLPEDSLNKKYKYIKELMLDINNDNISLSYRIKF